MSRTKTLDLVLKKEWYLMIERGEKTEEYREIKPYWTKRLCKEIGRHHCLCLRYCGISKCFKPRDYTYVRFRYGYTGRSIVREIESISFGMGNPDLGAPTDKEVFIIKFKKTTPVFSFDKLVQCAKEVLEKENAT